MAECGAGRRAFGAASPPGGRLGPAALVAAKVSHALDARPDAAWIVWRTDGNVTIGSDPADDVAIVHVYLSRTPDQVEAVVDAIADTLEAERGLDPSRVIVTAHAFRPQRTPDRQPGAGR